MNLFGLP